MPNTGVTLSVAKAFFTSLPLNDYPVVKNYIAEYGRELLEYKDADHWTPLMHAARSSEPGMVALLVDSGAPVNDRDRKDAHALIYAVRHSRIDVTRVLLERGASPDLCDVTGQCALDYAIMGGDAKMAEVLLAGGADKSRTSGDGLTPLMLAAAWDKADIATMLLEDDADMDAVSKDGRTAWMIAEGKGYTEVIAAFDAELRRRIADQTQAMEQHARLQPIHAPRVTLRRKM